MMLRSFIAVEIPAGIQRIIACSTAPLQKVLPKPLIRWVAPQNVHLTLKFLGEISSANLERLAEALKMEVVVHETFSMSIGGLGAFPTLSRARVIWIGLDAPVALMTLLHNLEAVTAGLGYAPENRPFSPHLTIGRVGQHVSGTDLQHIRAALEGTTIGSLGVVLVDAVCIFNSDLQPGGSVYTPLYRLLMKP